MAFRYEIIFLAFLFFSAESSAQSANDSIDFEKQRMILQLSDLTGAQRSLYVLTNQMATQLDVRFPSTNPKGKEYSQLFTQKLAKEDLNKALIAIYDKQFSKEELQTLISFYKTPLSRKAITEVPEKVEDHFKSVIEKIDREVRAEIEAKPLKSAPDKPN